MTDAQDLGDELQEAFDLTEQAKRLEDFRDSVAGVLEDLSSVAIDHVFDGFFGAADEATAAIQTFTDVFRGDIELLENDVTRLARQVEDSKIRLLRLDEDEERRIRQLERQRRALLARASTGDQRDAERTRQRAQDISFRIASLREDFDVRRQRAQEDADRRRNRAIEDAVQRRERFEAREQGESLPRELLVTLGDSVADKLSNALSGALAGLLAGALQSPFQSLLDAIKGLFGTGDGDTGTGTATTTGDGTGTGATDTTSTPTLTAPAEALSVLTKSVPALTAPAESLAVLTHSTPTLTAPATSLAVLTHSTPTLGTIPTVTIPTEAITPDIDAVDPITIPANAITPAVTAIPATDAIAIPAQAIDPTVNAISDANAITIPAKAIDPTVNAIADAITIPSNAVDPIINPVATPIDIPANPVDVELNLPDVSSLPPIDLGGIGVNLPAIPTIHIPFTLVQKPTPEEEGTTTESTPEGTDTDTTPPPPRTSGGQVPSPFEGRRDKLGLDRPVQTVEASAEDIKKAVEDADKAAAEREARGDRLNIPRRAINAFTSLASAILGSGAIGIGTGGGAGDGGIDDLNRDVAATLRPEGSPRSDFVVTLPANPFTNQGSPDPDEDDETAQAPAAVRFDDAADALNTISNVLSVDTLASVAQETTLASIATTLDSIRIATERTADSPIVDRLIEAGITFPQSLEERTNSPLPDFLTQQGIGLFADQDRLNSFLGDLGPTPNLAEPIMGGAAGSPLFIKDVDADKVQKVEVVGGKMAVDVANEVSVKQVGVVQVTQSGQWVIQLASSQTIPVYVQGGQLTADIAGGLEGLAIQLADEEVVLRAVGAL